MTRASEVCAAAYFSSEAVAAALRARLEACGQRTTPLKPPTPAGERRAARAALDMQRIRTSLAADAEQLQIVRDIARGRVRGDGGRRAQPRRRVRRRRPPDGRQDHAGAAQGDGRRPHHERDGGDNVCARQAARRPRRHRVARHADGRGARRARRDRRVAARQAGGREDLAAGGAALAQGVGVAHHAAGARDQGRLEGARTRGEAGEEARREKEEDGGAGAAQGHLARAQVLGAQEDGQREAGRAAQVLQAD
mmetsp:Transcript_26699/g.84848  ORF Transcript_26699/g.84848 Transcript_26699/m.84848 type:complete len:252 (+) Transcript_26699:170-925(+)